MLRRAGTISGIVGTLIIAGAGPALAGDPWGSVDCGQVPSPGCQLGAGQGGTVGGPGHAPPTGGKAHQDDGDGSKGHQNAGDQIVGPPDKTVNCSYQKSNYQPPPGGTVTIAYVPLPSRRAEVQQALFQRTGTQAATGQGPGAWYIYKCSGSGFGDGMYRAPIWIPEGQRQGTAPLPSPAQLARVARNQLRLPSPKIAANPRRDQLVTLPTWLWLSSGWDQQSATAAVPGVSVTAVAKPTSLVWSMGDGSTVTCRSGGTPFPAGGDPKASSPDCGHTYRASSAGQANEAYPVSATVHWAISWSGAGQAGTFPDMTTTASAAFRVAESQALNTGGG